MKQTHWERFHQGGTLATCPTSPVGGYDEELEAVWVDFFTPLPNDASILDVATGNGAVLAIASETNRRLKKRWQLHGSDLARINPVSHVRDGKNLFAGCTFHPEVATEALPFSDSSLDAVCGQYALEYSDQAKALLEISRVLKSAAQARFVLHNTQSLLVLNAHASLTEAELVLDESRLYQRLTRLVKMGDQSAAIDHPATTQLRETLRSLRNAHSEAQKAGQGRVLEVSLDAVRKLLEMRLTSSPAVVTEQIQRVEQDLRYSVRRLRDLLAHALSEDDMNQLMVEAGEAGLKTVSMEPQYHRSDHLVGWCWTLSKS